MRLGPHPPRKSKKRLYSIRKKVVTPPPKVEEPSFMSMLLDYVPPRPANAPNIRIDKNTRYPLITLTVLKGVRVIMNILLNMKKMNFVDHDLWKYLDLAMEKYIVYVCNIEGGPLLLVPMEW